MQFGEIDHEKCLFGQEKSKANEIYVQRVKD
jgi:hypothetical protein